MRYIIGNWKSNGTTTEALKWLKEFAGVWHPSPEVMVAVAPTFLSLEAVAAAATEIQTGSFALAAQTVSPWPRGNYTGAVAADLLKGSVRYVIVGHNERRKWFAEDGDTILNCATEAVEAGLIPLVCAAGAAEVSRLGALADLDGEVMLAYTPKDPAISGQPPAAAEIEEMAARLAVAVPGAPILYGGAVTADNAGGLLEINGISGLFVGAASRDAALFAAICDLAGPR